LQDTIRDGAHEVRLYRNSLVHPGPTSPPVSFGEALGKLNQFLAPLREPI
jgi:hypothetical protein